MYNIYNLIYHIYYLPWKNYNNFSLIQWTNVIEQGQIFNYLTVWLISQFSVFFPGSEIPYRMEDLRVMLHNDCNYIWSP